MKRYAPEEQYGNDAGPGPLFDLLETPDAPETPETLRAAFELFHRDNPQVYRLFCHYCDEAIRAGRKYLGAKMIWERMRWHARVETTDAAFKLNNNWHSFMARLWLAEHPEHPDFFETRRLKSEQD